MPLYVFKSTLDSSLIEKSYPMGQCPQTLLLDGELYHRVYTSPHISTPTPLNPDSLKIQEEVDFRARELGIHQLVPLKHQSPKKQLADLKANSSKFKDDMQSSQELTQEKHLKKQKEIQSRLHSSNTPENYLRHQEAESRHDYDSRKIKL